MQQKDKNREKPWYTNYILWLIILIPVATVIAGLTTLYIAVNATQSPVLEDYYKSGLSPGKNTNAAEQAAALGIEGSIFKKQLILIGNLPHDQEVIIWLRHPTLAKSDIRYTLKPNHEGIYPLPDEMMEKFKEHKWYLEIQPPDESWEIKGTAPIEKDRYILTPYG